MKYIIYDSAGEIRRVVECAPTLAKIQAKEGEFILEGSADDVTQKIINGKIVDKTPEEIEVDKPPESKPIPHEKQMAHITNEQWQDVLKRLKKLETKI